MYNRVEMATSVIKQTIEMGLERQNGKLEIEANCKKKPENNLKLQ